MNNDVENGKVDDTPLLEGHETSENDSTEMGKRASELSVEVDVSFALKHYSEPLTASSLDTLSTTPPTLPNANKHYSAPPSPAQSRPALTHQNSHNHQCHKSRYMLNKMKYYYSLSGKDPQQFVLRPPAHVLPSNLFVPMSKAMDKKQSSFTTIFSIWNTMVGSTLLSIPWGFRQAGLLGGIGLAVVTASLAYYSCYLIVVHGKNFLDFSDMCVRYLGKWSQYVAIVFSCCVLLGACIAYNIIMSSSLFSVVDGIAAISEYGSSVIHFTGDTSNKDHYTPTNWSSAMASFVLAVVLVPLCSQKDITGILKINSFGIISVIYLICMMIYESLDNPRSGGISEAPLFEKTFPYFGGILMLSFFIHNGILAIMRNQRNPENNARDMGIAFVLVFFSYLIPGAFTMAFFDIGDEGDEQNFLNHFGDTNMIVFLARLATMLQLITVYPLLCFIVRTQCYGFIFGTEWPSFYWVLALNMGIIATSTLFTIFYPQVGDVLRFTGASGGFVYIFLFPVLIHIQIKRRYGGLTWQSFVGHIAFIIVGLMYLITQFL